jgi:hypothetical protein
MTTLRTPPTTRLVILFAATVLLSSDASPAVAQAATTPAAPDAVLSPESMAMLQQVMRELQDIRKLEFSNSDMLIKQVPADVMRKRIAGRIDALYPPDRRDAINTGLARFGLIDRGTDVAGESVTVNFAQSAVVFNKKTNRLLIVMEQIPPQYLRANAAFRLAEALQHQNFDSGALAAELEQAHLELPRPDDRVLAGRFLLEGEPSYVQYLWNMQQAGVTLPIDKTEEDETLKTQAMIAGNQVARMASPTVMHYTSLVDKGADEPILKAMLVMADASGYVIDSLYAAQTSGRYFISFLNRAGGWDDVARAHAEPPVSTEQVLHPEKLLYQPDQPTPLNLSSVTALDNARWTMVDSAIHGEYYLYLLVGRWTDRFVGQAAATGWDGDLYQAWRSPTGEIAVLCATTWDTPRDAREFYEGYLKVLARKYPAHVRAAESTADRYSYDCGETALAHGWLVLRDREVFILEGFPAPLGTAVLEQLEAMTIDYVD